VDSRQEPDGGLVPQLCPRVNALFTLNWSAYADFLTFKGALNPVTGGLWLSDTAHHHLALAVLFIVAGHFYRTNWGIGHSLKEVLEGPQRPLHRGRPQGHV
jgi:photosystem I P700 chlorophyll a apoprotein A1